MGNSLTIISKKEKEELYKDLEGKWSIELDGNKIKNEDDFAKEENKEIKSFFNFYYLFNEGLENSCFKII